MKNFNINDDLADDDLKDIHNLKITEDLFPFLEGFIPGKKYGDKNGKINSNSGSLIFTFGSKLNPKSRSRLKSKSKLKQKSKPKPRSRSKSKKNQKKILSLLANAISTIFL